jgi:hypothetical protein
MPLALDLHLPVFRAGFGGAPTTSMITDLAGRIDSYEHSISATFGFESMRVTLATDVDEALEMLSSWLMASTVVAAPDGEIIWEGYLARIDAQFGQETRSVSLDQMANRVTVRYTTVLGTQASTGPLSDSTSIARYGTKDTVLSLPETTLTAAQNFRAAELARRKDPRMTPSTEIRSGEAGVVQVTLVFAGWYDTLGWLLTSNTATSSAMTTTQVGNLLATAAATNPFIATTTADIEASNISDTQYIAPDTTIRDAIERLLRQGQSSGQRLAWGVYENRRFRVKTWAGANPTTITYRRQLGSTTLLTRSEVLPWLVRPDAMYEVADLLDNAPVGTTPDAAGRCYIERVVFRVSGEGIGVQLEPQQSDALDARLARLGS